MLSKNRALLLMTFILTGGIHFASFADQPSTQQESTNVNTTKTPANTPANIHGEIDNTDNYAVPLDSSEEEQNEELNELQQLSKPATK